MRTTPITDEGMRTYRIKQIGKKYYLQTLDVAKPRIPLWPWKKRKPIYEESMIWRVVGENGNPAEMPEAREFWGTHNPVMEGFDTQEQAAAKIDEFREGQRIAYFYHKKDEI